MSHPLNRHLAVGVLVAGLLCLTFLASEPRSLSAVAATTTELVVNGGFESGESPWTQAGRPAAPVVNGTLPHFGAASAYLCGTNNCAQQLWQTIALPPVFARLALSYWFAVRTQEFSANCNDYLEVRFATMTGTLIGNVQTVCDARRAAGWSQKSADVTSMLSSFKGQSVRLLILGTTNSARQSAFVVDDVSMRAIGSASASATPTVPVATPVPTAVDIGGLTQVSSDPMSAPIIGQHRTEVEPDTFSHAGTTVAAFQVGRIANGGSAAVGWSTFSNSVWQHGLLPGITNSTPSAGIYDRATDPSVAYDAKAGRWLVSTLGMIGSGGAAILVSTSTDGLSWSEPVTVAVAGAQRDFDKDWIVCDNYPASTFYGNCYVEFDNTVSNDTFLMSTSHDGGTSWDLPIAPLGNPTGLGGQPLVQPNGNVIVPAENASETSIVAYRSVNGGSSWSSTVRVSSVKTHAAGGNLRTSSLPSAEIDSSGVVFVVWQDCRFESNCSANDIVLSTSSDGVTWTTPVRVPTDSIGSGVDHFIPGVAVDGSTSGSSTRLALTYYFNSSAGCTSSCQLYVGYVSSINGGASWSSPVTLAGPMLDSSLPLTTQGVMVGDYMSVSFVGSSAVPVFAVGATPSNGYDESMFSTVLTVTGGARPVDRRAPSGETSETSPTRAHGSAVVTRR